MGIVVHRLFYPRKIRRQTAKRIGRSLFSVKSKIPI